MERSKMQKINFPRRALVLSTFASAFSPAWATPSLVMDVWKGPSCGCCLDWIKIVEKAGFKVVTHDTGNTDARLRSGIPIEFGSCHTARIAGYAIEGHVPVSEIQKLLSEKPDAIGLAVPGMPIGSPGMDGVEYGGKTQPFNVLLIKKDGSASLYKKYL